MGMTFKATTVGVGLAVALATDTLAQSANPAAHPMSWPARTECHACAPIQFGELSMQIPLAYIEKIAVLGSESSALHLVPKGRLRRALVTFFSHPRKDFVGRYEEGKLLPIGSALSNKAFLDLVFAASEAPEHAYALIRKFEGIDKASALRVASRDEVHLYWIKRNRPDIDHAYIVLDGSDTTYLIAGELTGELFESILSNMRRTPLP